MACLSDTQQNQPTFVAMSTGIGSDGRQVGPVANMEPAVERPRGDDGTSNRRMSSKKAGKQPAVPKTSRASTRKRKLREVTGRATDEEVEAAVQSPKRNSSEEVFESTAPAKTNDEVTSDILPPWTQRPANHFRDTVGDVTDEAMSINGFVRELSAETELYPTEPSNSTKHAGPSAQMTLIDTTIDPSTNEKHLTRQSDLIPLMPSSLPPDGSEVVEEIEQRPPESNLKCAPKASPATRAPVEFLYRVVCRYPEIQSLFWNPEGSFRNKTLACLEEELPIQLEWSQFPYLQFRLTAPNTRAEHLVCRGREDQFDALKRHLTGIIRDCIANAPCGKTVLVEIDIEPLADMNSVRKLTDREVMDFEW